MRISGGMVVPDAVDKSDVVRRSVQSRVDRRKSRRRKQRLVPCPAVGRRIEVAVRSGCGGGCSIERAHQACCAGMRTDNRNHRRDARQFYVRVGGVGTGDKHVSSRCRAWTKIDRRLAAGESIVENPRQLGGGIGVIGSQAKAMSGIGEIALVVPYAHPLKSIAINRIVERTRVGGVEMQHGAGRECGGDRPLGDGKSAAMKPDGTLIGTRVPDRDRPTSLQIE